MARRRLPIGTEVIAAGRGAHVRVWAPGHKKVTLVLAGAPAAEPREQVLEREADGYHSAFVPRLAAGHRYSCCVACTSPSDSPAQLVRSCLAISRLADGTIDAFPEDQELIVENHNNRPAESRAERPSEPTEAPQFPWHAEVGRLLTQAAMLCVEHDVDLEAFMKGAWSAYVESRPGMREHLEEMQLRDQLEEVRKLGRMAEA